MYRSFIAAVALRRFAQVALRCSVPAQHISVTTPSLRISQVNICRTFHNTNWRWAEKEDVADQGVEAASDILPEQSKPDAFATLEGNSAQSAERTRAPRRNEGRSDVYNDPAYSVHVSGLLYETTSDSVRQVFSQFGNVVDIHALKTPTGLPRGVMFVRFDNPESASRAILEMNEQELDGRRINVNVVRQSSRQPATPQRRKAMPPSNTLFIGNLNYQMSDRDLNDLFKDIRNITAVRVAIDRRTGQPRGFAHADFIDIQSAQEAKRELDQKMVRDRPLRVDFAPTTNSPERSGRFRSDTGTADKPKRLDSSENQGTSSEGL